MLLLLKGGELVPLVKAVFLSFTDKQQRRSRGARESVCIGCRAAVCSVQAAGGVLVLPSRSKVWEAMRTNTINQTCPQKQRLKIKPLPAPSESPAAWYSHLTASAK